MDEIAALLDPLVPALRRYAWTLVRDQDAADDLVQDALERAIRRWHLRQRDGDARAWLFAILRNLFISGLRQRARRGPHVGLDQALELPAQEPGPERQAIAGDALAALARLPEEQRSLLLLVGVEDLSYQELAHVFGVPQGTIMSRLSRARALLRRHVEAREAPVLRRVK